MTVGKNMNDRHNNDLCLRWTHNLIGLSPTSPIQKLSHPSGWEAVPHCGFDLHFPDE